MWITSGRWFATPLKMKMMYRDQVRLFAVEKGGDILPSPADNCRGYVDKYSARYATLPYPADPEFSLSY